jgi:methionyl aminopeptidase
MSDNLPEYLGEIHTIIKREVYSFLQPGVKLYDVRRFVESKIEEQNLGIAFPVGVNLNECAAHHSPFRNETKELKEGDLITVDFGIQKDGQIIDSAFTKEIITENYHDLIDASRIAVETAIMAMKPGVRLADIGYLINKTVKGLGYNVVDSLCGHRIGKYKIHDQKIVPCIPLPKYQECIEAGEIYAVEVFTTKSPQKLFEVDNISHYCINYLEPKKAMDIPNEQIRRQYLNVMKKWNTLPFHIDTVGIEEIVKYYTMNGYMLKYPPLYANEVVAHWEHTIKITESGTKKLTGDPVP